MCRGFGDRLLNEVKRIAPKEIKLKIFAPPERKVSSMRGMRLWGLMMSREADMSMLVIVFFLVFDLDWWIYLGWSEYIPEGEDHV